MKYIGIPYKKRGRDASGCDCYGLVKLFLQEEYNLTLEDYNYSSMVEAGKLIEDGREANVWRSVDVPRRGDVVVLRQLKRYSHVGVMVDDKSFIHCEEDIGTVKVSVDDKRWSRRIGGYYRHKDLGSVTIVRSEPIIGDRTVFHDCSGITLADVVKTYSNDPDKTSVIVQGYEIPREIWQDTRLQDHAVININTLPAGDGRSILRTVLSIAVLTFAGGAGGQFFNRILGGSLKSTFTLALGKGIASALGLMIVNALVPPAVTNFDNLSETDQTNAYSIAGAKNRINPYGAVPVVLGKHRVYPPFAAKPYTLLKGDDQYLYCLFAIGYGDLTCTELKIGDTLLSNFDDVNYEISTSATRLYPASVNELDLSVELDYDSSWQQRTAAAGADDIILDIAFAQGLVRYDSQGRPQEASVVIEAQESLSGAASWSNCVGQHVSSVEIASAGSGYTPGWHTLDYLWSSIRPSDGLPEVRAYVRRDFGSLTGRVILVEVVDSGNFLFNTPVFTMPASAGAGTGAAFTVNMADGYKFKASSTQPYRWGMRTSIPDQAQTDIRVRRASLDSTDTAVRDIATWTNLRSINNDEPINVDYTLTRIALEIRATGQLNGVIDSFNCIADTGSSNPADVYENLLTGEFNAAAVTTSELDTTQLAAWETFCNTKGFEFNAVLDSVQNLEKRLKAVCAAGRATLTNNNSLYSVVIDEPQTTPIQVFTARNTANFQGSVSYIEMPHALRCRFINEENDYQQEEVIVYADGYDSSTATIFERQDFFGVTNSDAVWKLGRYYLAVIEYQRESFSFDVDVEHISCTRGDLVIVENDIPQFSVGSGRVTSFGDDFIELDESMVLDSATSYSMTVRNSAGINQVSLVAGQDGETRLFKIASVPAVSLQDVCVISASSTGRVEALITSIKPKTDFAATITCIPYNSAIYTADGGVIPPYVAPGTTARDVNPPRNLTVNEYLFSDNGTAQQGVTVAWNHSDDVIPDNYEVQIKRPDSTVYEAAGITSNTQLKIPDTAAGNYSFRVRARIGLLGSEWVELADQTLSIAATPPPDVTNLQATYRNGKVLLSWDKISDVRGIEYVIRYGSSWDGGSTVSEQAYTEYFPGQDGSFYIKARTILGQAVSTNAALINVDGINLPLNVVKTVVADWSGELTKSCYSDPDVLSRHWSGTEGRLPQENDGWYLSGGAVFDSNRLKAAAGTTHTKILAGMQTDFFENNTRRYEADLEIGAYAGTGTGNVVQCLVYFDEKTGDYFWLDITAKSGNLEFETWSTAVPVTITNPGRFDLRIDTVESTRAVSVYVDGSLIISSSSTTATSNNFHHMNFNMLMTDVNGYLYSLQCGDTDLTQQDYIKAYSGVDRFEASSDYYSAQTAGTYEIRSSEILDLGHDDIVIGAVTKLRFHGSENGTDLLSSDDLLSEADLFFGASSKLTVQPQIAVKKDGAADYGEWQNFVNGSYEGRYFKARLLVNCEEGVTAYITDFEYTLDMEDRRTGDRAVALDAGGTSIVYNTPFQVTPTLQVTQVGAISGDTLIISSESTTGFTAQVLDSTGTGKAAVINWDAVGY